MSLDILINGGGIAGPCLAFWLTKQGHAVTITEQASQLRTGGQAVDFRGPSLVVLEKMGLLGQVRASATQMGPLVFVDERGKEVGRLPAEVISGELEIFWGDLARILHEAVRDDVNYRFGVRVTALSDDGGQIEATFSDASTGTFDLVFGADGLHSGVRALVFGPEEQHVTQLGQYFGFFDMENHLRLDHCGMACGLPGRTAMLQATDPDKPARASFYLTDHQLVFDYRATENNKRLFAERFARMGWEVPNLLKGLAEASEVYFDSIAQVHLSSYSHDIAAEAAERDQLPDRVRRLLDRRAGAVQRRRAAYRHWQDETQNLFTERQRWIDQHLHRSHDRGLDYAIEL